MPKPTTPFTLTTLLQQAAHAHPTRTATTFLGQSMSYAQLHQLSQSIAAALTAHGVQRGQAVAICLPNCPAFIASFFAILQVGAVVVPLNPLYTAPQLHQQLRTTRTTLVIGLALQPVWGTLQAAIQDTQVQHLVGVNLAHFMPPLTALGFRLTKAHQQVFHYTKGTSSLRQFVTHRHPSSAHRQGVRHTHRHGKNVANDHAVYQFTGGTTGVPKAAILTHSSLSANLTQLHGIIAPNLPQPSVAAALPFFHVFALTGVMLLGIATGATLHLLPQFNLKALTKLIKNKHINLLFGVPALFQALLKANPQHLTSLKFCVSGGAPMPPKLYQQFQQFISAQLLQGYGLTECSPVIAVTRPHTTTPSTSVGQPLTGTQVSIRQPTAPHRPLPTGQTGEVWVKGPQVMAGYLHQPAENALVFHNGWLRTGDLGHLDKHGFLHLTDRLKDLIMVNGFKVFPKQIEDVISSHPAVAEVAVVAHPHAHKGEVPMAYVTLTSPATAQEILTFAATSLHPHARPAALHIVPSLPKTMVGKIDKRALKQKA